MSAFVPGARAFVLGAFLAGAALAAYGGDAPKPELGAGPHQDFQPMEGGNGDSLRPGSPQPTFPKPAPEPAKGAAPAKDGASAGSSAKPSDTQSPEDERRATDRKDKAKKRPGYQEDAPSPRASGGGNGGRVN